MVDYQTTHQDVQILIFIWPFVTWLLCFVVVLLVACNPLFTLKLAIAAYTRLCGGDRRKQN